MYYRVLTVECVWLSLCAFQWNQGFLWNVQDYKVLCDCTCTGTWASCTCTCTSCTGTGTCIAPLVLVVDDIVLATRLVMATKKRFKTTKTVQKHVFYISSNCTTLWNLQKLISAVYNSTSMSEMSTGSTHLMQSWNATSDRWQALFEVIFLCILPLIHCFI